MVCDLVVSTMLNAASEILDLQEIDADREAELVAGLVDQLRLIFLGAAAWKP